MLEHYERALILVRLRLGHGTQLHTMVIPFVGQLTPASGKKGVLPRKSVRQADSTKTFQEEKNKYWLVQFEKQIRCPLLFDRK